MFPNQFYSPYSSLAPLARRTINWGSLLSNTQKTLNIVNQAIPIVYQIKPMVNNARTMFKVASEFSKTNMNDSNQGNFVNNNNLNYSNDYDENTGPSFFI